VTNNVNVGNPERPPIMGQFAGCITGMAEACTALAFPVVSGNVSLYNETDGRAIPPTPVIGGVGLVADVRQIARTAFTTAGLDILVLGETLGHLGQSLYAHHIAAIDRGAPPPVDLVAERAAGNLVRALIAGGQVGACHDLSDGGLAVALAEMVLAGGMGADLTLPDWGLPAHAALFGEDQGRYLIATAAAEDVLAQARDAGVPCHRLGVTGGDALTVAGVLTICVEELRGAHTAWFHAYMG